VAVGKARASQLSLKDGHYNDTENPGRHGDKVLCIQVHGDASFSGQVYKILYIIHYNK
jgi:probable 2-oxoglutarate dehydrogenase E1 component DHKTD1